jgi:predicted nucleic acid-binding protein
VIPASAFIDSSVLIAASKDGHVHRAVATAALRCLRESMAKVRVSSLVWAELNRNAAKHGNHEIPGWIRVLPFDKPAAEVLASQFPTDRMRVVADTGMLRECWSFDRHLQHR